jgi:hypothetical protein
MIEMNEKNAMDSAHSERLIRHTKEQGLKWLKIRISEPYRVILILVSTWIGKNPKTEPRYHSKSDPLRRKKTIIPPWKKVEGNEDDHVGSKTKNNHWQYSKRKITTNHSERIGNQPKHRQKITESIQASPKKATNRRFKGHWQRRNHRRDSSKTGVQSEQPP